MYAVKSGGKAVLIGSTIGTLVTGIGMRHRETLVEVVERRPDPYDELTLTRRCVLPQASVRAMVDIGVSKSTLTRVLKPARRWKFVTTELVTLREVDTYTGCSPSEPVFHCTEGELLRALRTDFMRFGGTMHWGCTAYHAEQTGDDFTKWQLNKDYGPCPDAEIVVSYARSHEALLRQVVVPNPDRFDVLFDQRRGVATSPPADLVNAFGPDCDVMIAIGHGTAMHLWRMPSGHVSFNMIVKGRTDNAQSLALLHPLLANLVRAAEPQLLLVPGTAPAIRDEARHFNIGISGDAVLPVDPFEWRGDNARHAVDEASMMVRALYGNKFHRGNVAVQLREMEQDSIVRRADAVKRDLLDAEMFLRIDPLLPRDEDNEPESIKRIGGE
jgi:hypothetical protein